MSRPNPASLFGFLLAVILALGGLALVKGGLYLTKHEGDTLHLIQIVLRMAAGEWPHLDFMTPIGVLAFAPIALFVMFGAGLGHAILLAQILVAICLLPALWWACYSRFRGLLAYGFGLIVLVLVLALVAGEAEKAVSISMHYNRWAWAASFVVIVLAMLPARDKENRLADGLCIGLGMAALALCKVTYFVGFAPAVIIALLLRGQAAVLLRAALTGAVALLIVTAWAGTAFWGAYLDDLRIVAQSSIRPWPGDPLQGIVGSPEYLGGSLVLIAGVILLRQAGETVSGLILLLLAPGFIYVTYQNFGNDPQWLLLLAVLLVAPLARPLAVNVFGWNLRQALSLTAAMAFALIAPSFFNMAYSPFRHLTVSASDYRPLLARSARDSDLLVKLLRSVRVDGRVGLDGPGTGLERWAAAAERAKSRAEVAGERLPDCELQLGVVGWLETIVADIASAGLADGNRVFAADVYSAYWLFGDLARLQGGAPWYYSGLPGFESADLVAVPLCPVSLAVRKQILDEIAARGVGLREVLRTPLVLLFEKTTG